MMARLDGQALLRVENLQVRFTTRQGMGAAVNDVSFEIFPGETLGLVGESGCGKSATALALVGLLPQSADIGGHIWFQGEDLAQKSQDEMRAYRGNHLAMVLQDPMTALHPLLRVGKQIAEPLRLHRRMSGRPLRDGVLELMRLLHIPRPSERADFYPHQFSGGMRQRVVSAIGLAGAPELLIADEPTTALDVTVQAAYLSLLKDIQRDRQLSLLFISHDLSVIADVCHRVAVMYGGTIVEVAPVECILNAPHHPYTKSLLASIPDVRRGAERLSAISGAAPSIYEPISGCRFHPRCPLFETLGRPQPCQTEVPKLTGWGGSMSACHFNH